MTMSVFRQKGSGTACAVPLPFNLPFIELKIDKLNTTQVLAC